MERSGDGAAEIAVRTRSAAALFSPFDPSPLRERDLDPAVEAHLVDWARELPSRAALRIAVELPPAEAAGPEAAGIGPAMSAYFAARARSAAAEQRELFRTGRVALAMGIGVLAVCLLASQALALVEFSGARLVSESLVILGWVANWRPLEIYLYDWWPIRRRRRLFERLAAAPVAVRPAPG
jgi:hypothetical protein